MRPSLAAVVLAAALAAAVPAHAAGPNGGQTTVADGHPVEFVASETEVTFFLQDHGGKPLDTAGLTAKAHVRAGGRTETIVLGAAAPNRFVGTLSAPLSAGAKVVLTTRVHGHAIQARFEL